MAATSTPTTLASRLKQVYANGISNIIPSSNELLKRIKFKDELAHGASTEFDVQLSHESGFSTGTGEITLNAAIAQVSARATVVAYSLILRSKVSYDLITRAKDDKKAFARFNDAKFIPMVESFRKRQEILLMHGQDSIGKVSSVASQVVTFTNDSWCPAIWLGSEGMVVDAFTARSGGSQHDSSGITVVSVDIANKAVTFTGITNTVASDYLFFKGGRGNEPVGLMTIARNTGTLYGISATTYALWAANTYDVGTSALTLGKILQAAAKAADKGCDEALVCLVPIGCFQSLVVDQSALREHGADYSSSKGENGFSALTFYGATGPIEIVPYLFCKQGEALLFPAKQCSILGSSDMTSVLAKDGDIIFDLESTSAKEMRLFADYTAFCEKPGWMVLMSRSDAAALDA